MTDLSDEPRGDEPRGDEPGAEGPAAPARRRPTALMAPMRRVLRLGALGVLVAVPAVTALGYLADGSAGAWGALIGIGIAVAFFGVTVAVALLTAGMDATKLGIWVLGSWLVKMIILVVVLALLRDATFYSRPALFAALLLGTAGILLLEARVVATERVPYVEPIR